eukprot:1145335-Pelagomonas_calceolata.AAC.2
MQQLEQDSSKRRRIDSPTGQQLQQQQQQQQQQLQQRSRRHLQTASLKASPTTFTNEVYHALQPRTFSIHDFKAMFC